jgi:hypothetical protein
MTSVVQICNRALQKLGERRITSLGDDVKAARECVRAYEGVRQAVFRDHPWNCLVMRGALAALAEAPEWGYGFQYQLPVDCLRVLEVDTPVAWHIEGRRILADAGAPLRIRYLRNEEDPSQYDAQLAEALAARLAVELAESLTQSNTKRQLAWEEYDQLLTDARRTDAREGSPRKLMRSTWLEARR